MRIVSSLKTLLLAAGIVGLFSTFSGQALAHSSLVASLPGNEAVVSSPGTLELSFDEDVRLLRLTLVHGPSHNIEFGFEPSTAASESYSFALPALMMGAHTVNWTVIGSDSHPVNGSFSFTVSADGGEAQVQAHSHDHGHDHGAAHSHGGAHHH